MLIPMRIWIVDGLQCNLTHKICFIPENATDENRQDLLAELNTMKKLDPHPNVIQLLGCVTKTGKKVVQMDRPHKLFSG